jgi:hypothetical protein
MNPYSDITSRIPARQTTHRSRRTAQAAFCCSELNVLRDRASWEVMVHCVRRASVSFWRGNSSGYFNCSLTGANDLAIIAI